DFLTALPAHRSAPAGLRRSSTCEQRVKESHPHDSRTPRDPHQTHSKRAKTLCFVISCHVLDGQLLARDFTAVLGQCSPAALRAVLRERLGSPLLSLATARSSSQM